ncbi:MAG: exonuclease subunit SbcD [Deltaproteobacteria bacterium]|jgi:exonuclease SbcD|nr:exonuclease subunit SbcD [Deltaproteobacteria bacterium]
MRIVHTSDWHAGRLWRRVNRIGELEAALTSMCEWVEGNAVDLVLMTGDVFDNGSPHPEAERLVFRVLKRLGKVCPVVLIAGNHDDPRRIEAWGQLAELAQIHCIAKPRRVEAGGILEFRSRDGRERARVAPIPFAPIKWFVEAAGIVDEGKAMAGYAEKVSGLAAHLAEGFSADAINILMAHTHVEGAKLARSERAATVGEQWAVTPENLPLSAQYIALGHIHRPQAVRHGVEYAGSPLQLDFGEEGEEKSFVVIDATVGVPVRVTRVAYLGGTPLKTFEGSWAELEAAAGWLKDAGHLRVQLKLDKIEPDLVANVRRLVPNAIIVKARLPEVERVASVHASDATPLDRYRVYHAKRHGMGPDAAVEEAFRALWEEVTA